MCVFHAYEKHHFGQVSTQIEENAAKLGSLWPTDLYSQQYSSFWTCVTASKNLIWGGSAKKKKQLPPKKQTNFFWPTPPRSDELEDYYSRVNNDHLPTTKD